MSRRALLFGLCLLGLSLIMVINARASRSYDNAASTLGPTGDDSQTETFQSLLPMTAKYYFDPKLTLWHMWSGDYFVEYQKIVREYNLVHPDLAVQLVFIEDIPSALGTAITAGEGPNIIAYPNDRIGEWAAAGYLAPLDTWINLDYLTNNYEPAAAQAVIWDDQIWGVPDTQEGIALVYNKALISEAQLPESDDFTGLLNLAEAYYTSSSGLYYLCNQGLGSQDAYHVAPIYFGFGLSAYRGYVDEDGIAYMDTTEALNAANWISGFRPWAPAETSHMICRDMLVSGEAAIWWTGPWAMADLQSAELDYGIAPMGIPFVGVKSYLLSQATVDQGKAAVALDFMKYLGSAEVQKRLALANHTIPANTTTLNDPDVQAIYDVAQFGAALNQGIPMGNHIYSVCQWTPVGDATMAIWDGSLTPQEAMQAAQDAIEVCVAGGSLH